MFGRVDFREDGKKRKKKERENKEGKLFRRCLVRRGRRENDSGTRVFSPRTRQKVFSPKWRENLGGKMWKLNDKIAHVQLAHGLNVVVVFFFISFFFLFFFSSVRLKLVLFFFNSILLDRAFAFCFGLTRHDFIF